MRTYNGPEFTCRAFIAWAQAHRVRHILIQPGRPMQNGYIENGTPRLLHNTDGKIPLPSLPYGSAYETLDPTVGSTALRM